MKILFLPGLLFVLVGCTMRDLALEMPSESVAAGLVMDTEQAKGRLHAEASPAPTKAASNEAQDLARKVIYTADFQVRIVSLDPALERARKMAEDLGGFVLEERIDEIRLRVPVGRFKEAVSRISEIGRILSRRVRATDVTEEYVDLEIRLDVKKRFLMELQELYKKGGELKDLLEIKREIDKVTEEIERIKGRLRYLKNRVAFSTITVKFKVATQHLDRTFRLPFLWLEDLGIDRLLAM